MSDIGSRGSSEYNSETDRISQSSSTSDHFSPTYSRPLMTDTDVQTGAESESDEEGGGVPLAAHDQGDPTNGSMLISKDRSRFLELPSHIRLKIYEYSFPGRRGDRVICLWYSLWHPSYSINLERGRTTIRRSPQVSGANILATNSFVYKEASRLFHEHRIFRFSTHQIQTRGHFTGFVPKLHRVEIEDIHARLEKWNLEYFLSKLSACENLERAIIGKRAAACFGQIFKEGNENGVLTFWRDIPKDHKKWTEIHRFFSSLGNEPSPNRFNPPIMPVVTVPTLPKIFFVLNIKGADSRADALQARGLSTENQLFAASLVGTVSDDEHDGIDEVSDEKDGLPLATSLPNTASNNVHKPMITGLEAGECAT